MAVDIPNYRVVEKLGVGAQTRVFRARCMRTGKDYTVKIVKILKPEDTSFIDLLRTEYAIGSCLDHPVIRKVYELRMLRHRLRVRGAILFMEYVDGVSLGDKGVHLPLAELIRVFTEAAKGLDAVHRAGYVHADLKPSNIMLAEDNSVKLIDLGQSSKIREAKPRIQGTIDYMAPEQVQRRVLDERTDVFGLGAALHKIITGKAVKTEMNRTISLQSQSLVGRRIDETAHGEGGGLGHGNGDRYDQLPACINRLIEDCCRYRSEDRIADMATLIERLEMTYTIVTKPPSVGEFLDDEDDDDFDAGTTLSESADDLADRPQGSD